MSRMPAITPLLNGQAVKMRLVSTIVTAIVLSRALTPRATVAPAKPPPTTTTWGADWARLGRGNTPATAPNAAAPFRMPRRVVDGLMAASSTLLGVPGRDGLDLRIGEAFGNLIHDGRRPLAGSERLHLRDELGGVASGEARNRGVGARTNGVTARARRRARRRLGGMGRRNADRQHDQRRHEKTRHLHARTPTSVKRRPCGRRFCQRCYAVRMLCCDSGNERMRLPVAAKMALSTAGAATKIVGSPTPPQKPPEGMMMLSTFGISAMRITL